MITQTLNDLLQQKTTYDQEYDSIDEMPARTADCYRNLLAEIRKAAKRNQGILPGISRTDLTAGKDQMVLI